MRWLLALVAGILLVFGLALQSARRRATDNWDQLVQYFDERNFSERPFGSDEYGGVPWYGRILNAQRGWFWEMLESDIGVEIIQERRMFTISTLARIAHPPSVKPQVIEILKRDLERIGVRVWSDVESDDGK